MQRLTDRERTQLVAALLDEDWEVLVEQQRPRVDPGGGTSPCATCG
ncbi:hypothetical protein [Actinoplanes sp. NPDC051859]